MILDTSAIVAVIEDEPEADQFLALMLDAPRVRMSASTYVDTGVVIDSRNDPVLSRSLDTLLEELGVTIEPVTTEQAVIARRAYRDFGKGRSHPAQLNFGNCFSYALAVTTGDSLLFTGEDFTHTDIQPAARN